MSVLTWFGSVLEAVVGVATDNTSQGCNLFGPMLLLCPRQSPSAQHPPLLSSSTHPVPRTLTEGHTSRCICVLQDTPENVGRQKADLGHNQRRASELQTLHHSHREVTRLYLMAVREGDTDAQIPDVLRQGLPHLTDPVSLHDRHTDKEPEVTGTSDKDKQSPAQTKLQTKRTRKTSQDDWSRTWRAGRTIMLRRTSKRIKEVVDKMCLPAVVCLSRSFWGRRPLWNVKGKAPVCFETTHIHVNAVPHHHTRTVQL